MSKADVLLKKATLFEQMARKHAQAVLPLMDLPGQRLQVSDEGKGYYAANEPSQTNAKGIPQASLSGPSSISSSPSPTARPAGQPAASHAIDKGQQEALSRFVTMERLGIPISKLDGTMNPETRQALSAFKNWYNQYATKKITNDQEALQFVKYLVDSQPEKYGA